MIDTMKDILRTKVWPVFAALLVASATMMVFEFVNSYFYPIPADINWQDRDAVVAFTDTLPFRAYILVLMGWVIGSFLGGWAAIRLAKVDSLTLPLMAGGILAVLGLLNNMMLGQSILFSILTLPLFIAFAYMGGYYGVQRQQSLLEQ